MTDTDTLIPTWVDGTLVPFDKLQAHLQGLRHQAVSVFVMQGDKTLIQRRALGKYHTPGLWANSCCTHPLWEEAALDCANRRLEQELGITGLAPVFRDQVEYRADVGGGMTEHEVVDIFVAEAPTPLVFTPNPDEVMDTVWVTLPELAKRIEAEPEGYTPWLKIYLADYAARIFT
jgi:isopentenyl-diphosphate delta-isomerase